MKSNFKAFTALAPVILAATLGLVGSSSDAQEADGNAPTEVAPPDAGESQQGEEQAAARPNIVAAPAASSTTKLSTFMSRIKSPNLKFSFLSQTDFKWNAIDEGTLDSSGAPKSFNFLASSYALTPTRSIIVRQEFNYTFAASRGTGDEVNGKAKLNDIMLGFTDTNLIPLGNEGFVAGIFRVYLPTGEDSRSTGRQGMVVGILDAIQPVGKWDLEAGFWGSYHNQTKDGYYVDKKGTPTLTANADYDLYPWIQATYNMNSQFSFYQSFGHWNSWARPIPGAGVAHAPSTEIETAMIFKPVPEVSIQTSVYNSAATANRDDDFALFRAAETQYRLVVRASL